MDITGKTSHRHRRCFRNWVSRRTTQIVFTGLGPVIQALRRRSKDVDARDESAQDELKLFLGSQIMHRSQSKVSDSPCAFAGT